MKYFLLFLIFSSNFFGQVFYNEGEVNSIYNSWTNACTSETLQKPIFLKKRGTTGDSYFCNQGIGNPDVIAKNNGEFYIYSGGDEDLGDKKVGDAIVLIIRKLSGAYDLEKDCTGKISPILNFYPDNYGDDPKKRDWSKVGGMGQGMAVIYSPTPDACGHHYFGIVPVWDKGDRECEEPETYCYEDRFKDDRAYLAWAFSSDGINWKFLKDASLTIIGCDNETWQTANPKDAFPFLHRDCFQMTGYDESNPWGREVFHHIPAFYSDPTKHDRYWNYGDGYIYLIFGYTPLKDGGIWNLMARVKLDLNEKSGLGEVQIFKGDIDGLYCPAKGNWQTIGRCTSPHQGCSSISTSCERGPFSKPDDACIPCNLDVASNKYIFNLSEPLEWKPIYKGDLLLEHFLVYHPSYDFPNAQTVLRVSDRIIPPFYFSKERALGNCLISKNGYSPCEAGGADVGLVQPPCTQYWKNLGYYDANCNPLAVVSYFNVAYKFCPSPPNVEPDITLNPGGLIASKLSLSNTPWTEPICYYGEGLKIKKQGQNLNLFWTPSTDTNVNAYRVYEGKIMEGSFLKDGIHCPYQETDDKIVYDHYRKICYTENNYIDISIPVEDKYYLIAPICDRGAQLFQCYSRGSPFPFAYISEGPFCRGTGIDRERGVCHCPEDNGCGGFYEYFPQPGDNWR